MKTVLKVQAGSSLTIPWAEFISKDGNSQEYSFSMNDSKAVMKIIINGSDMVSAIDQILGYSVKKADGTLGRFLPMRHPKLYWMFAQNISVQPLAWQGKDFYLAGPISDYEQVIITITFISPPYEVFIDGTVAEYQRYVIRNFQPTSEVLTIDNQFLKFDSTQAGATKPAAVSAGSPAKVPSGYVITKHRLVFKWLQVPDNYLFNAGGSNNGGLPTGVTNGIGKVNLNAFMGYAAKTLLLESPQFESVVQPIDPSLIIPGGGIGGGANFNSVPRAWNVTIPMLMFVPPINQNNVANMVQNGWNSAPAGDGNWWGILNNIGAGGGGLYGTYDFTNIFKAAT